jgi:hypothetical protein
LGRNWTLGPDADNDETQVYDKILPCGIAVGESAGMNYKIKLKAKDENDGSIHRALRASTPEQLLINIEN